MATHTGIVKWFDRERGFGFISACEGNDIFLHHSQVKEKGNNKDIHEGESVVFDIVNDKKGLAAVNVHKL
jgi:CspA family cold shock protein